MLINIFIYLFLIVQLYFSRSELISPSILSHSSPLRLQGVIFLFFKENSKYLFIDELSGHSIGFSGSNTNFCSIVGTSSLISFSNSSDSQFSSQFLTSAISFNSSPYTANAFSCEQ